MQQDIYNLKYGFLLAKFSIAVGGRVVTESVLELDREELEKGTGSLKGAKVPKKGS